jgi:L-seryl-tRNA(Ser) seleniumtransferase
MNAASPPYRALPAIERLAASDVLRGLPRETAIRAARQAVNEARETLRRANGEGISPTFEALAERAAALAGQEEQPTLRRAVNATGVLLHTNLGRATLAPVAVSAVADVAAGHAALEVDEETGGRGSRQDHIAGLLRDLTGAEDAFVVNNNAGATFLAIMVMAAGRDVVLSRGQMVEIGGQFRLPDVIASAGAHLVEVGTTNRTRATDYERALTEETALLLRVHPSNYRIMGYTESASLEELVALGKRAGVPVADDIGSGALVDFAAHGLADEPTAPGSIAAGADVVWFSGDKLLGGPQAGILVGKAEQIAPMKAHPLARALRLDKMTLSALEATLRLYRTGRAWAEVPVLRRIARPADDVLAACGRVARLLRALAAPVDGAGLDIDIVATESEVGGGSLPGHTLPSWAVAVTADDLTGLARALRRAAVPVYGRIEKGRLLLDLRAVDEDEEPLIATAFDEAVREGFQ